MFVSLVAILARQNPVENLVAEESWGSFALWLAFPLSRWIHFYRALSSSWRSLLLGMVENLKHFKQISEKFEGHNLLITQTCFQLPVLDSNLKTRTGSLTKLISRLSVLYNYRGYRYIIILQIEILVTPSESFRIKNQKVMRLYQVVLQICDRDFGLSFNKRMWVQRRSEPCSNPTACFRF